MSRSALPWMRAAVALAALSVLCCAPKRPLAPRPAPSAAASVKPLPAPGSPALDLQALAARRIKAQRAYEEAIDLIAAGEEIAGEEKLAAASTSLQASARECAEAAACDLAPFLQAFEALMTRQTIALKQQSSQIGTLETTMAEEETQREPGTSPVETALPEIGRTVSLFRGTELKEIITLNGPVNAAINDWLTWMRPMLLEAYHNYEFLRDQIAPVYEEAGLPEALLFAMLATETGGKVHAYSKAGAAGLLQFMPQTGRRYGLSVVDGFDLRLDPVASTRANVAYLDEQFRALNDDLEKALAAYNGGETRVKRLHDALGGRSIWDPRMYYALPAETREYVPRILAAAWLFLHPDDYNLELPRPSTEKTQLVLRQEIALSELTICLGQEQNPYGWFRVLRNLNPRLDPGDRIPAGRAIVVPSNLVSVYERQCLDGAYLARARELHDAQFPAKPKDVHYVVRRGDTLSRIAARHSCVSVRELARLNGLRPPRYSVRVGQLLKIPSCS